MPLPVIPLPTATVQVGDAEVTVRSLTRAEALQIATTYKDDLNGAEVFLLSCGLSVPLVEAKAWHAATDPGSVNIVLEAVAEVSALRRKDGKDPQLPSSEPS